MNKRSFSVVEFVSICVHEAYKIPAAYGVQNVPADHVCQRGPN